ncbi:MAG: ABC transporter permease [Blastocatellia bacterium]|nr:ABC transporter permease [Blastocatellia bacterium]
MRSFLMDLRYGARMLWKSPGFTLVVVLTLALGIGANTAIFSVIDAALVRALPYREAERLAMVWERSERRDRNVINLGNFFDWKGRSSSFEDMAAFADFRTNLTGSGDPVELPAQVATANLFAVLGVDAILGRTFTAEDATPGRDNVVVLSYGLWQRRFGGDVNVIGKKLTLNNNENIVIGVLPPDFNWHIRENSLTSQSAELWTPWAITEPMKQRRGRFASAVARLRPGVDLARARAEMDVIAGQLTAQYQEFNTGWGVTVTPLREQFVGEFQRALWLLFGAVGLVLLIACANVANLLLARAATRQKEIAVRAALGAGRGRIVRQLLTESLLLAALGGAAGLLLAWQGTRALVALAPPEIGAMRGIEVSAAVFGFTFAIALLTGLLFGLIPALDASNLNLSETLKEAGKSLAGSLRSRRLRSLLVVGEIALALMLLVGAGLLLRSFQRLQSVDVGFNPRSVLTLRVALPGRRYTQDEQRISFFTQAVERMQSLPGVQAAGVINYMPFAGPGAGTGFEIEGRPKPLPGQDLVTGVCVADRNFFPAMQIALKRGRFFTEQEVREARRVVVVNEALARKYFPNEEPLGKRITIAMKNENAPTEIIGIVADVKHAQLDKEAEPMSYWPIAEMPYNAMTFVLRTSGDPLASAAAARGVIQSLDPQQPVADVRTLAGMLGNSIARQRFNALLFGVFAAVALALSAIGIYGVVAYSVAQRTHEFGIRSALGASSADLLRLVLKQGMRLAAFGVAVGLLGALAATRLMKTLLFNVSASDPLTFAAISLLLVGVALLACFIPARRAAKIDPMDALRCE